MGVQREDVPGLVRHDGSGETRSDSTRTKQVKEGAKSASRPKVHLPHLAEVNSPTTAAVRQESEAKSKSKSKTCCVTSLSSEAGHVTSRRLVTATCRMHFNTATAAERSRSSSKQSDDSQTDQHIGSAEGSIPADRKSISMESDRKADLMRTNHHHHHPPVRLDHHFVRQHCRQFYNTIKSFYNYSSRLLTFGSIYSTLVQHNNHNRRKRSSNVMSTISFLILLVTSLFTTLVLLQQCHTASAVRQGQNQNETYHGRSISSNDLAGGQPPDQALARDVGPQKELLVGYLTNLHGRHNQARQGAVISGAVTYAIDQLNRARAADLNGYQLKLIYNDTSGQILTGTKAIMDQWRAGAVAWFGPEDSCAVEPIVASAVNLPMISYKCAASQFSLKRTALTFVRTHPPDSQVVSSVISLLGYYGWHKFSIISEESPQYQNVAHTLHVEAVRRNLTINSKSSFDNRYACCEDSRPCCENAFLDILDETASKTRIYVFLGTGHDVQEFLQDMLMRGMLDEGNYLVIYVALDHYSPEESYKYVWRHDMSRETTRLMMRAAQSLLVIVPSPPAGAEYSAFLEHVRKYNLQEPFKFVDPFARFRKHITVYAAYLYDAVALYVDGLIGTLRDGGSPRDGRAIVNRIIARKRYQSITGVYMNIDANGDVEGNYTVLSRQRAPADLIFKGYDPAKHGPDKPEFTMLPVGGFDYDETTNLTLFKLYQSDSDAGRSTKIEWVGGTPPLAEPPCLFDGSGCLTPADNHREILAGVLTGLFFTVVLIATITYRNWKYEQEIAGLLWKIQLQDIVFGRAVAMFSGSRMSIISSYSTHGQSKDSHQFGSTQPPQQSSVKQNTNMTAVANKCQVFTERGCYRGAMVAIKRLVFSTRSGSKAGNGHHNHGHHHSSAVSRLARQLTMADIPRDMKIEMKIMREIHHSNVNAFIGAAIEPCSVYLVTEYCDKGSLQDILENDDYKLDAMFVSSLVFDLIAGLAYLHGSDLKFHGNLKSSNCVVTSRWVLQVTDYGLHQLRSAAATAGLSGVNESVVEAGSESDSEQASIKGDPYRSLLWRAPELLQDLTGGGPERKSGGSDYGGTCLPDYHSPLALQKGDMYALGVILHEIMARAGPWGLSHDVYNGRMSPRDIVERVRDYIPPPITPGGELVSLKTGLHPTPEEPFRPDLSIMDCQDYVKQTMISCWAQSPEKRPTVGEVRNMLKPMRKEQHMKGSNIMDHMMVMMERYANNLEDLVNERTLALVQEKNRTDALLDRMLPKTVAAQLMKGEMVIPESFDAVTIFFSDIVGFTAMSSESTPLEIVTFLNDLYTLFDGITAHYDAYKVETIGDAYMVVSGLPIRNGDKHASEIASMAIELLDSIKSFKIRHKPNMTLNLRIGIHTGPVVAGVVGTTMPRYCLFGDTVNTASRMESNGQALKIHISPQCRDYLVRLGGYDIQERGLVAMKGKGEVLTYWLLGHSAAQDGIEARRPRRNSQDFDLQHAPLEPLFSSAGFSPQGDQAAMMMGQNHAAMDLRRRLGRRGSFFTSRCGTTEGLAMQSCQSKNMSLVHIPSVKTNLASMMSGTTTGGGQGLDFATSTTTTTHPTYDSSLSSLRSSIKHGGGQVGSPKPIRSLLRKVISRLPSGNKDHIVSNHVIGGINELGMIQCNGPLREEEDLSTLSDHLPPHSHAHHNPITIETAMLDHQDCTDDEDEEEDSGSKTDSLQMNCRNELKNRHNRGNSIKAPSLVANHSSDDDCTPFLQSHQTTGQNHRHDVNNEHHYMSSSSGIETESSADTINSHHHHPPNHTRHRPGPEAGLHPGSGPASHLLTSPTLETLPFQTISESNNNQ